MATSAPAASAPAAPAAAGRTTTTKRAAAQATTTLAPGAARRNAAGQYLPNGRPAGPAVAFEWSGTFSGQAAAFAGMKPRSGFVSALIIGSDARPKENPQRSRGDSIHIVTWNQALGKGTVLGIPRDTWVPIAAADRTRSTPR